MPSIPAPASIEPVSQNIVGASTNPFTGQQQIQDWQASYLELSVTMPPLEPTVDGPAWVDFLISCQGQACVFQIANATWASLIPAAAGTNGYWRLKTNSPKWSVNQGTVYGMTFEIREAGVQSGETGPAIPTNEAGSPVATAVLSVTADFTEGSANIGVPSIFGGIGGLNPDALGPSPGAFFIASGTPSKLGFGGSVITMSPSSYSYTFTSDQLFGLSGLVVAATIIGTLGDLAPPEVSPSVLNISDISLFVTYADSSTATLLPVSTKVSPSDHQGTVTNAANALAGDPSSFATITRASYGSLAFPAYLEIGTWEFPDVAAPGTAFNGWRVVTMPSHPAPASIEPVSQNIVGVSMNPFSGDQEIQNWAASWMELSVTMPPLEPTVDGPAWVDFLISCQGQAAVFQIANATWASLIPAAADTNGYWRLKNNSPKWSVNEGTVYGMTFEIREAI